MGLGRQRGEHAYVSPLAARIGFPEPISGVDPATLLAVRRPSNARSKPRERHARSMQVDRPEARTLTTDMAVTLAERRTHRPILGRRRRAKPMEKFVIEGGVPLSGTMVPAGNKNGALPILASSLLTEDEVIVRNVPRIRDVEAMLSILRALGVEVSWRGANEVALCAAAVHSVEVEPELAELPAPDRRLHGRAVGHGDRERADGCRADAGNHRDRQRRIRAPRPGPRA